MYETNQIRNFVIIAHIDHGKSTLADRFLELTGTVEKRKMREQFLDMHPLEREKGITIKMAPVRMIWRPSNHTEIRNPKFEIRNKSQIQNPKSNSEQNFILNLIDTPGHVDFSYEVSRALAAVEGAILLVDATQGIQAQTLANLHLAQKEGLVIIPAVNKIDLPSNRAEDVKEEIKTLLGCRDEDILFVSGKTGEGVKELLFAVVERVPPPQARFKRLNRLNAEAMSAFRALIFDSQFDAYKGIIAYVRIFDGKISPGDKVKFLASGAKAEALEVGIFSPERTPRDKLSAGEIGYIATGIKEPELVRVGDTITYAGFKSLDVETFELPALPGYEEPKPMVFASIYPEDTDKYEELRDALRKLKLNDAALFFEPESSAVPEFSPGMRVQDRAAKQAETLGRGFRVGFLGMLHLEITGERLRREYGLIPVFSTPSVSYKIALKSGEEFTAYSAAKFPEPAKIAQIQEPWVRLNIISDEKYLGATMKLLEESRGTYVKTNYLGHGRLEIIYEAPLREIIVDFYDRLKSITEGYGSMSYEIIGWRASDLVKLEIIIAGKKHNEFSMIVPRITAYAEGRRQTAKLKNLLPRQLFPVAIQAAIGGEVIARETLPALKKDVTGYLYGGDRTRKMKLWKKQQKGKRRLKEMGQVEIPQDVFLKMIKK